MFKTLILAIERWRALRQLPRSSRRQAYLYFEYTALSIGVRDRVLIYEYDGKYLCKRSDQNFLANTNSVIVKEIDGNTRDGLFRWLKSTIDNETRICESQNSRDYGKFVLFAEHANPPWKCAIRFWDLSSFPKLGSLAADLMKRVENIISEEDREAADR